MSGEDNILKSIMTKAAQPTPSPTLQEQAQAYAGTKIDGKYPGPVEAFLAGHAQASGELEQLKEDYSILQHKYAECIGDQLSLRSKLQVAEKALKNIFDHTSGKSYLWAFEALDKIQEK